MQLAVALLTIYAAFKWIERPQSGRWLLAYSCASVALLYAHYLPGLAITVAVWLVFLLNRSDQRRLA